MVDLHDKYYGAADKLIEDTVFNYFTGDYIETVHINIDNYSNRNLIKHPNITAHNDFLIYHPNYKTGYGFKNLLIDANPLHIDLITFTIGGATCNFTFTSALGTCNILDDFKEHIFPFLEHHDLIIIIKVKCATNINITYDVMKITNYVDKAMLLMPNCMQCGGDGKIKVGNNIINVWLHHPTTKIIIVSDYDFGDDAVMNIDDTIIPLSHFNKNNNIYTYEFVSSINFSKVKTSNIIFNSNSNNHNIIIIGIVTHILRMMYGMIGVEFTK